MQYYDIEYSIAPINGLRVALTVVFVHCLQQQPLFKYTLTTGGACKFKLKWRSEKHKHTHRIAVRIFVVWYSRSEVDDYVM